MTKTTVTKIEKARIKKARRASGREESGTMKETRNSMDNETKEKGGVPAPHFINVQFDTAEEGDTIFRATWVGFPISELRRRIVEKDGEDIVVFNPKIDRVERMNRAEFDRVGYLRKVS